ncbi:MAG: 16S rRNA (cytosine(1402)-N(4))-methyltransferase RsmH [bacterium]|nr:16S rRNA (cytosine(1402)-N(4))-methyltransferase RsmH [bacterium]
MHQPVMVESVIENLNIRDDGIYADLTAGFGGHSKKILEKLSERGKLVVVDRDPFAFEHLKQIFKENKNVIVLKMNFKDIALDFKFDGILLDLGVSSFQYDTPKRGFSYRYNAPLDLRMDTDENNRFSEILNMDISQIASIIKNYSDEYDSYNIAKEIFQKIQKNKLKTTFDLKDAIIKGKKGRDISKGLKRVFMAFRIFVNDELNSLQILLNRLPFITNRKCRVVIITYHSIEDRLVKNHFKSSTDFLPVHKKVIKPKYEEIISNKRAKSAKMRVLERV